MKTADTAIYRNPIISELNRVPNFNPLKYLRDTESGPELDVKYKKLWFRLKYPNGRIRLSNLRVTDQIAIIEARVFLDRKDNECIANYTAHCDISSAPDGDFLKAAQDMAIDRALSDAGFGIQFSSEISVAAAPSGNAVKIEDSEKKASPVLEDTAKEIVTPEKKVEEGVPNASIEPVKAENTVVSGKEENAVAATDATAQVQPVAVENDPLVKFAATLEKAENSESIVEEAPKAEATANTAPAYTKDMSVEEICAVMTIDEAENYVVTSGTCVGQKMSTVAERRPASLRFYKNGYKGDDNILRAAATVILAAHPELLAA